MKGKLTRPVLAALVIVGGLVVAGGIAYATIPDSSGVIHACYHVNRPDRPCHQAPAMPIRTPTWTP